MESAVVPIDPESAPEPFVKSQACFAVGSAAVACKTQMTLEMLIERARRERAQEVPEVYTALNIRGVN